MKPRGPMTGLQNYKLYSLKAQILDDPQIMSWFADLCAGETPKAKVSEETLALMEGRGFIRKTDFGWVFGKEGREFGRELGVVPGPSRLEINPSIIMEEGPKGEIDKQIGEDKGKIVGKEKTTDEKINIEQVWERFFQTHDEHLRNLLMENYRYLVKYCAERLHKKLPDKVDIDDLISAGIFGLMDAIDAFNPSISIPFEEYCSPRIKGAILDELRSMDWVPRLVRARSFQLDKTARTLETRLGRIPTQQEISRELDIDMSEFDRLRQCANKSTLSSIDFEYKRDERENDIREIDIIKDERSKNPVIEAQKRDLKALLTKGLTRAERLIVVLYYYEEMTMKEIGRMLDLSESRVSQMHSSIIARLKSQMSVRKKEFSVEE
jgi:RNA polymerase sigma factor for flagellar operon FliA